MCQPSATISPATAALLECQGSNKRVKRSTMDSPSASVFSFDMSELFSAAEEDSPLAFPSIEWSFDDKEDDDEKSVSSTCTNLTSMSTSSLGKRGRTSGLTRTKNTLSFDLMG